MIWIAVGKSDSGDDYTIGYWTHKPTKTEMKKAFGCDDEWPFISWDLWPLEAR